MAGSQGLCDLRLLKLRIQLNEACGNLFTSIGLALSFNAPQLIDKGRRYISFRKGDLLKNLHNLLESHILRANNRARIAQGAVPNGRVSQKLIFVTKINHPDKSSRVKRRNSLMDWAGRRAGATGITIRGESPLQILSNSVLEILVDGWFCHKCLLLKSAVNPSYMRLKKRCQAPKASILCL